MVIPLPIFSVVNTRAGLRIRAATLRLCALANSIFTPSGLRDRDLTSSPVNKKKIYVKRYHVGDKNQSVNKNLGNKKRRFIL